MMLNQRMFLLLPLAAALLLPVAVHAQDNEKLELAAGQYAVFHTSDGDFVAKLHGDKAPQTVKSFVELAQGKKSWRHPVTLAQMQRPLYNNTTLYRTIPGAAVYGGDPASRGAADNSAMQPLEIHPELNFDKAGVLAMEGNGQQASSSRFLVALKPFPEKTGNHTIFGQVTGGLDVIERISKKPTRQREMPLDPVLLSSIEIVEIPEGMASSAAFEQEEGRKVLTLEPPRRVAPEDAQTTATASGDVPTSAAAQDGLTTATIETTGTDAGSKR